MKSLLLFLFLGIATSAVADDAAVRLPPTRPGAAKVAAPALSAAPTQNAAPAKARVQKHAKKKSHRAHKRHAR